MSIYHIFTGCVTGIFYFSDLVKPPPAHRQSGKAQRPAATAGGCQAAPGSGAAEGVRGTPRQRERLCNFPQALIRLQNTRKYKCNTAFGPVVINLCYNYLYSSLVSSAAERSSGVSKDV